MGLMEGDLFGGTGTGGGSGLDVAGWTGRLKKNWAGQAPYAQEAPKYDPARADVERNLANQVREGQGEYNQWLKNAAMGQGPSVAQQQLSQGRDQAIAAAASQAAAARGGNAALANRTATQAGANMHMQAARDAAALRAQEQMGYANQWGQGLQAQRSGDLMARGQTIDEGKADIQAQTNYQQMAAQAAGANAERGQGIFGDVLGNISDPSAKVFQNPGQPAVTTGGAMTPAPQPAKYSDQFAGIAKAQDDGTFGKSAEQQARDAEESRQKALDTMGKMGNTESDHGAGLIASVIGMMSDPSAKTFVDRARGVSDMAKSAAGEYVRRGTVGPPAELARRAAEKAAAWLSTPNARMRSGGAEASRYGVERAKGSADLESMSSSDRARITAATRGPEGQPGSADDNREYARKAAQWMADAKAADEDRRRYGAAQNRIRESEDARSGIEGGLMAYRDAMVAPGRPTVSDTGAKMFTDSDPKAKVPSLGGTGSGDEFNQAANSRMGVDQEKAMEEALLRAGLDRVEREATVDGGLRAGKTNVARFADVEPIEREMAQIPERRWQYKEGFAQQTNQKMGLPHDDEFGYQQKTSATTKDYEAIPATRGAVLHDPKTGLGKLDGGQLASTAATGVGAVARHAMNLEARTSALEEALRRALAGRG